MKKDIGLWIPAEIKNDDRLTLLEKFILSTVIALCGERGCFATNQYIADTCGCKTTKVSQAVAAGVEYGYITAEYEEGVGRTIHTPLHVRVIPPTQACNTPLHGQITPNENLHLIIDNIDDTIIYADGHKKSKREMPTLEEVKEYCGKNKPAVDAERFYNYYSAKGWMIGKNKVVDWTKLVEIWRDDKKPGFEGSSFDADKFFNDALRRSYGVNWVHEG